MHLTTQVAGCQPHAPGHPDWGALILVQLVTQVGEVLPPASLDSSQTD